MSAATTTHATTLASRHAMAPAARSPMAVPRAPTCVRRTAGVAVRAMAEQAGEGLNKYSSRITQPKSQGASQAMLYATGMNEEDMNKPQVAPRRRSPSRRGAARAARPLAQFARSACVHVHAAYARTVSRHIRVAWSVSSLTDGIAPDSDAWMHAGASREWNDAIGTSSRPCPLPLWHQARLNWGKWGAARSQVGISSVWYEGNPCNMHLMDLAAAVKEGVEQAGMVGMRFNTIGVSDGISMGTDGMSYSLQSRDIIADSIETVPPSTASHPARSTPLCPPR